MEMEVKVVVLGKRVFLTGPKGWYRVFPNTTQEAFSDASQEVLKRVYERHVRYEIQRGLLYDSTLSEGEREEAEMRNHLYLLLYPKSKKKR